MQIAFFEVEWGSSEIRIGNTEDTIAGIVLADVAEAQLIDNILLDTSKKQYIMVQN